MRGLVFVVISAFTFRVLERLNAVLTTVKLVFSAHLTPFTVVLVVVLRLKSLCIYYHLNVCVLLYGLDSCPANVTELRSLEHPVTMAFMKIVNTNSIDIVSYCQSAFGFHSVR